MRFLAFLLPAFCSVALSGCGSSPPEIVEASSGVPEGIPSLPPVEVFDYPVGPGDILRINVFRHPELSSAPYRANQPGTPVDASGNISLPLIGEVMASGRNVFEIRDEVRERLGGYLREPRVDVAVVEHKAHRFFIFGEVRQPGAFFLDRPTQAIEALALAGGFTTDADRNHVALVRGPIAEENIYLFDTEDLDPSAGRYLQNGDILFVTQRDWATIGQASRDLVPLLQLLSLPVGTARDVVLIEDIRKD